MKRVKIVLGIALFLITLSSKAYGQGVPYAIKAGLLRTWHPMQLGQIGFEGMLGDRISVQPLVALGYRRNFSLSSQLYRFWGIDVCLEGRVYWALRRKMALSGLYTGVSAGHERFLQFLQGKEEPTYRNFGFAVAGLLGYQYRLGSRIIIDGGIRLGYFINHAREVYSLDGRLLYEDLGDQKKTMGAYLRMGVVF